MGKLSDVIRAIKNVSDEAGLELDCAVAVVDAKKAKMYMKNFGEFFSNQIENATTVVLSRTQMVDEAKLNTAVELVKELNEKASIITTPWDDIDGKTIAKAMEGKNDLLEELVVEEHDHEHHHEHDHNHKHESHEHSHDDHDHHHEAEHGEECTCGCQDHEHHYNHHHHDHDHDHHHHHEDGECCHDHDHDHHHHHHHDADEVFTSWGMETPKKYDEAALKGILETLSAEDNKYGTIIRAKGIVPATYDKGWIHFDMVPGEYEIRRGTADYTGRLCVIGTELDEEGLKALF